MKRTIKLWEIALLIGCLLTLLFGNLFQAEKTVSDLQQHVLRMHILANSDSDADQQLKYQVRDALLASSETLFGSSQPESREALETTAKAHLHEMETIAQQVVQEQGYSYPVKAELVTMPFTERTYEDLTMPAGTYEAIRITIGAAAGQNWWCVMYPPLCIPVQKMLLCRMSRQKPIFPMLNKMCSIIPNAIGSNGSWRSGSRSGQPPNKQTIQLPTFQICEHSFEVDYFGMRKEATGMPFFP